MQLISLGKGCYGVGTITHEIGKTVHNVSGSCCLLQDWLRNFSIIIFSGHAVGFWHEQSRPDRDEHVEILWHHIPDSMREFGLSKLDTKFLSYARITYILHALRHEAQFQQV